MTTSAENENSQNETNVMGYWKTHSYYTIVDEIVKNMKTRF